MNTITLSMNDEVYCKLMKFINTFPEDSIRQYKGQMSESEIMLMIANKASREAQRKNLENGIPNVYSKNGVMYFQLPDGTITMDNPFEKGELKERLDALTSS